MIRNHLISPIKFFTLGTFFAVLPFFFTHYSFFESYPQFVLNSELILIYFMGWFSFTFGALIIGIKINYEPKHYNISTTKTFDLILFYLILSILCLTLLRSIAMYGGVPLLGLFLDESSANLINEAQTNSGGILGFLLLLQFLAIAYIPLLRETSSVPALFKKALYIILFFSLIYTGKRQMLFYSFFYWFGYYYLYNLRAQDWNALKSIFHKSFYVFVFLFFIFWFISSLRSTGVGIFYPAIHYLSLPFINNMYMYDLVGFWHTRNFSSIFEVAVPTLIRSTFDIAPVITQPQLEPTISGGLFGRVFWAYGFIGVMIYCFIIGFISQIFYVQSFKYKIFAFTYPLFLWPLLMIGSYDHFMNAMFFIIPIALILLLRFIYITLRRNSN